MGQVQLGQLAKFTKSAGLETADGVGGEAEAHQAVGEVEGVAGHLGEPVAGQVQLNQVEEAVEGLLVDGGDGAGGEDDLLEVLQLGRHEDLALQLGQAVPGQAENLQVRFREVVLVIRLDIYRFSDEFRMVKYQVECAT